MPKKATVVFIPVPVSILYAVKDALEEHSNKLERFATASYEHGDDNGFMVITETRRKVERVIYYVARKQKKYAGNSAEGGENA